MTSSSLRVLFRLCGFAGLLVCSSCDEAVPPPPAPPPPAKAAKPSLALEPGALKDKIPLTGYAPSAIAIPDDAALFEALNLDYPGLETVKVAVEAGDYAAARTALARYYRQRKEPRLVIEGKEVSPAAPTASDKRLEPDSMAEQAMRHDYQIAGIQHKFDGPINWELNPTTQPGYKGAWSGQFHTQLNRMHYWRELAEAWAGTGNPAYRKELLAQMRDWRAAVKPVPVEELPKHIVRYLAGGGNLREYKLWLPLDTGQRTSNTTRVFEILRTDPGFDDESLIETVKMVGGHARLLTQLRIDGNHLAIATAGLAAAAVMFPEFKDSTAWLREAVARVGVEIEKQVYPDGAQMELTPWYHFTALRNFASVLELAAVNGYEIPAASLEGLRRMFEYVAKVADPSGFAPPLNDSEYLGAKALGNALVFFPGDPVFSWFGSGGAEGKPPEFLSLTVPYAGQAVMRSGWEKDARYLLMEYGPFGTGHMHEDKLGLTVNAHGRRLLVDSARNKYEASTIRDYSVNASAHSTVLFDGLFQARRLAKGKLNRVEAPVPVVWQSGPEADYLVGSYGADEREVFALPTDPPGNVAPEWFKIVLDDNLREDDVQRTKRMVQHRHVLFVKPDYWVVVDTFDPLDAHPHEYTSLFQMGGGETVVKDSTVTLGKTGEAGMALACSAATGGGQLSVVSGQKDPFFLGWSFTDGEPRPSPTALFRFGAAGPAAAACAIIPHPPGAPAASPRIEWLPADDGFYRLRVEPGNAMPPVTLTIPADGSAGAYEIANTPPARS